MTWRSILLGLVAAALVCGLTPLNDFVLTDTSLAAGFLPLIAVVLEILLIVVFNGVLHRFAGRHALRTSELAVVVMMTLIACSIPNWGMMRFFMPVPVSGAFLGSSDPPLWSVIQKMNLPAWLFPTPVDKDGYLPSDPVVTWFYNRTPAGETPPYLHWIKPLFAWGIFIAAMLTSIVCIGRLVLEQWMTNERLPFPLVQLHSALIEAPAPGRSLNDTLRSPLMWIGLVAVFFVHSLTGLNHYFGPVVPKIPMGYDFTNILTDGPLQYLRPDIKRASLSFMVIGATYFIRSRTAFSVWAIYILVAFVDVTKSTIGGVDPNSAAWADAHIGACAAFIFGMIWVGRQHWARVLKNAFGVGENNDYRLTFWLAVLGIAVMFGWLMFMHVQVSMALMVVAFILRAHLVVTRVVAETGLPFFRSSVSPAQIYTNFAPQSFTSTSVFFTNTFTVLGVVGTRDSVMTFTQTGLGVAQQNEVGAGDRRRLGLAVFLTFVVGCFVAASATLYCQYNYPTPMAREEMPARNNFGAYYIPQRDIYNGLRDHASAAAQPTGKFPAKPHNTWIWMGIGFVATAVLEVGSKLFAGWPLLPVGFVSSFGAFIGLVWFSIFIGWMIKALVVRFGGSSLYLATKPIFIGIILGEALAAGAFVILNAILVANGFPAHKVTFLLG
ncbi:MAG: hypothetical protein QM754_15800 [Tepidisphaeraceae bacterium]